MRYRQIRREEIVQGEVVCVDRSERGDVRGRMVIGRVVRPHGLRGELVVDPVASREDTSFSTGSAFLCGDEQCTPVTIIGIRWHKDRILVQLEGVQDRTAAEELRGSRVEVRGEDLPPLPSDTYYVDDLVGCRVISLGGEDLGEVDGMLHTGGVDVLSVRVDDGGWLLPAASEFVVDVDLREGLIRVRLIDGLRDLTCW